MTKNKPRKLGSLLFGLLLAGSALLLNPKESRADVTCSITHTSDHDTNNPVTVGQTFNVSFTANASGTPNANNECTISNLHYKWNVQVIGSDGGSVTYTGTNPSISVPHTANNLCQSYAVSATCTVSYDTSPECQVGGSSVSDGDSLTIGVTNTPCQNQ